MQDDSLTIGKNTVKKLLNYMEKRSQNFRVFIHVRENLFLYKVFVRKLDPFLMSWHIRDMMQINYWRWLAVHYGNEFKIYESER